MMKRMMKKRRWGEERRRIKDLVGMMRVRFVVSSFGMGWGGVVLRRLAL